MNPQTDSGIPKPKRGSLNPHTKTGIPEPIWGCISNESPNRFGDPQTKTGIPEPSYQNGDPRTEMGIPEFCSVTNQKQFGVHSNLGADQTRPPIGTGLKTGTPYWFGDPRTGLGRDLSKFRIWGSLNQFGVHSNLGTNMYSGLRLYSLWAQTVTTAWAQTVTTAWAQTVQRGLRLYSVGSDCYSLSPCCTVGSDVKVQI